MVYAFGQVPIGEKNERAAPCVIVHPLVEIQPPIPNPLLDGVERPAPVVEERAIGRA
jgi:hypothetical protein